MAGETDTGFHLTARPWTASTVTAEQLLSRVRGEMSYFAPLQASNGTFPDQFSSGIDLSTPTSIFAYGAALLASTGDTTYLAQGLRAMDVASAQYGTGGGSVSDGPEFDLAPLVNAYMLFKASGLVSATELAKWANNLSGFHYTQANLDGNWSTYAMYGAWLQYKAGLVTHATAVSEIEKLWTTYQTQRENSATDGLYVDGSQAPTSLSVEVAGRGNITSIVADGYDGPSAAAMATAVQEGGAKSLLMLDPTGQVPVGGRTDDHLWVDAGNEAVDQILATMNATTNPALAAQYQRAADLTFQEMSRWQQSNGSFSVTKNEFSPTDRVGYQSASQYSGYNANLMELTGYAYQQMVGSKVTEQPTATEIGGYVYSTPSTFAATFANAGGTSVEIETQGRTTALFGQTWNALGIDRIGRVDWDTRLGPSDGVFSLSSYTGVSFGPTWVRNSNWTHLAERSDYSGRVTTQLATPVLTELTIVWAPTAAEAGSPTFTQKLTITPDGILSQTTESGASVQWGMTLPLMLDDGKTKMTQSIGNGIASTSYPGGTDAENFIALNSDAVLKAEGAIQSSYGDITPVRATTGASEQDLFIYPSSAGDPSASAVKSSLVLNGSNYTSDLGWVNGTLYAGRTSAGGYGSAIALSGSGTPDVVFSKPVDFILQISNGTITNVETDAAVTATIGGKSYALAADTPQAVSGVATPPARPTIFLSAPGTVQEASVGAGVTVTETVSTTNLSGIYEEVLTASGAVETGYQAVAVGANGTASFSVHLAHSGDTVRAVDTIASPTVTANSGAVTITDPSPASGPAVVSVAKPATLVAGQDIFTGIVTSGTPGVVKFAWHASPTGDAASSSDMVTATKQPDGSYTASLDVDHVGQAGYFYVAVDGVVTDEWSAVPAAASSASISLSAPGTVQEASVGAGVTVNETVATTGGLSTIYAEVLTASGAVETGYQAVTIGANGTASFSVHLAHSGDTVRAVDTIASPTVTASSGAVTITDPSPASGPAVVSVAKPATLVAGQDIFTGIVTSGTPGVVKFAWHASPTGETASFHDMVTATKQADGSYTASLDVDHAGQAGYLYVAVDGVVTDEWSAVPVAASSGASTAAATLSIKDALLSVQGTQGGLLNDVAAPATTTAATLAGASAGTDPSVAGIEPALVAGSAAALHPLLTSVSSSPTVTLDH